MNNRPNIGRVDVKNSPAAKIVKTEPSPTAGNQPQPNPPVLRDGSRFSAARDNNSRAEQSQAKDTETENIAKSAQAAADDTDSALPVSQILEKEKKFSGRCRLFVGNVPNDLTEADFQKFFEPFGELNEVFLNASRGFGFLRLDTRHHAENARAAMDGYMHRGRPIRVRFAAHSAAVRVKYLSPHVSNEMLAETFSMFGEVERAVVVVDDKGKPTGEGIVEFTRKAYSMTALKRIGEGVFLMTSSPRPIAVEPLEQSDENDGLPEIFFVKSGDLLKEREQLPRFAKPSSFEYEFGMKWKALYQMLFEQQELLKKNFEDEVNKMEMDMEAALMEQHTALLREDLMRRQEELNRLEEKTQMEIQRRMDMRKRQEEERRRQNAEMMESRQRDEMMRRQMQQPMKRPDEDPFGGVLSRGGRPGEMGGMPQGVSERSTLLPRPERSLMQQAQAMQPPPVPPGLQQGIDRPRQSPNMSGPGAGQVGQPGMHAAGSANNTGDKPGNVTKFMPPALMQQQPQPTPQVQQRPRFEQPHQGGQGILGPGRPVAGPGGENPRMPGMPNNRDEFFDPKRMRRF